MYRSLRIAPPVALLSLSLVLAGCSADSSESASSSAPAPSSAASTSPSESAPEWGYTGAEGPANWGDVAPACAGGPASTQSPIDIDIDSLTLAHSDAQGPVELAFKPTTWSVFNNGHTVEAAPEGDAGGFTVDGTTYTVAQFHFHDPSEHTIDGANAPMEMHIVAKTADGKIAVLGLLFEVGDANADLAEVFASMPAEVTEEEDGVELSTPIDLGAIVPAGAPLARYMGSLTTPPCTEGVLWDVYLSNATISADQLAAFQALYTGNNRPVQDLNGREIDEVTETAAG